MNLPSLGIRKQILIIILIILIPVFCHLWYSGYMLRQQAMAYVELQVEHGIRLFSERQERFIEETRQTLSVMAHLPGVQDMKGDACNASLKNMHAERPNYSTMVVVNPEGVIECCSLPLKAPLNVADRGWYKRILQTEDFVVGDFIISRTSGKASLPFAYPVKAADGNLRYIIGAALNLGAYDRLFAELSLPEGAHILIADRQGAILYNSSPQHNLIGKHISSFRSLAIPENEQEGRIQRRPEHAGNTYWLHKVTVGHENNDVFVFVGIPRHIIFSRVNNTMFVYVSVLAGIIIITGYLCWYYGGRYIADPLQALVRKTVHVAAGELDYDEDLPSYSKEVTILASAFNEMTKQLAQRESDRIFAEQALRESEQRYRSLFEHNPLSLWEQDFSAIRKHLNTLQADGVSDLREYFREHPEEIGYSLSLVKALHVNQASVDLYNAASKEELLLSLDKLVPEKCQHLMLEELVSIAEGRPFTVEVENCTLDGKIFPVLVHSSLPYGYEESWSKVFISVLDLSERYEMERKQRELQQQLVVAQKLETVGTLAGGIAHDFNNILSPIIGYAEIILSDQSLDSVTHSHLSRILMAAHRAKEMVHQILAFSRRRESSKEAVDLSNLAREALDLLRSSIPSTIEIRDKIESNLSPVYADAGRIHQVIMNLCTNSYQAMKSSGGIITVGVQQAGIVRDGVPVRRIPHLLLFVEDTGQGISEEIVSKIFEPFFTTKPAGEGSGMGLSVVHGIIKEHEGEIELTSTPGIGTRFTIYLPCTDKDQQTLPEEDYIDLPRGNEHILVVDDEEQLSEMIRIMLQGLGYTVSVFTDPLDGLAAFRDDPMAFNLLLTDQTMPTMTGIQLTQEFLSIRSDFPIILYTGFSETVTLEDALKQGVKKFLYKPVSSNQLAVAIRSSLDE
ncbi:ATP-binding protein [Desulfosediminicola flagellatus]|uniref:ATP-binding protein n=1 Tax=Desulfosediminicola flagellatus TaxID=2569541 RepID=UPI0010AB5AC4|nr:ATP-binding protein [Desulfosediminicola flagellatus]